MENEIIALKNTVKRERDARKEAELIIESKSRELFALNTELKSINTNLENIVEERTKQLSEQNVIISNSNIKLEAALKVREHILSGLGHELQTPLHLIAGNLDLIEIHKTQDNIKIHNQIFENIHKLQKIVKNITYFSDLEVGKIKPQRNEFNISKLFDSLSSAFNYIKNNHKISLEFNYKKDFKLFTDYEMFFHIFINIIDNCVKYSKSDKIKIILNCICTDSNDVSIFNQDGDLIPNNNSQSINSSNHNLILEFHIVDEGIGIKKDILKNILMPFSKFDGTNLYSNSGSGLGLPITKKLVNLLGGELTIDSIVNHGTDIQLLFEGLEFECLHTNESNIDKKYNLPNELQNRFNDIKDTFILEEYELFARELIVYPAVSDDLILLGKNIIAACDSFDILKVQDLAKALE